MSEPSRVESPWGLYAGDPARLELTVRDTLGAPVDLSGRTWLAQWRESPSAPDAVPITADTTDAATGILVLSLTAEQTRAMTRGGVWDVQHVGGSTLVYGTTTWRRDVSR